MISRQRIFLKNLKVLKVISRILDYESFYYYNSYPYNFVIGSYINEAYRLNYPLELKIFLFMCLLRLYEDRVYPLDHWKTYNCPRDRVYHQKEINQKLRIQKYIDCDEYRDAIEELDYVPDYDISIFDLEEDYEVIYNEGSPRFGKVILSPQNVRKY